MSMWSMLIIDTLVVFDAMNPNEVQVGFSTDFFGI